MKQLFFLISIFSCINSYGQTFEGTLTYFSDIEVAEKLLKKGITKEQLIAQMKKDGSYSDTIKVSYKKGDYYTLVNTKPKSWSIYKANTNKIYAMQAGEAKDICTVTDASIDTENKMTGKMPSVEKLDTSVIVNGASCNVVRVRWKSGIYDYYYDSTKLIVDPILYAKHIYDGWSEFLKISKSLPVRIVKTTKGAMTITLTLVSTKKEVVSPNLFLLPKLVPDDNLNLIKYPNREFMRIKK